MTQAHPEGPYMTHIKPGGFKIRSENSEKWIEDAVLHDPLPPHLYKLQEAEANPSLKSAAYGKPTSKKAT